VSIASNAPSSVTNSVSVSGGGELNTANDSASDITPITAVADLTVSSTHSGPWLQGQTGASYVLTVSNVGQGASSGAVTVSDALPAGLNASELAGPGWTCDLGTLSCARSDALAAGTAYPPVLVVVNVAADAPASVINAVSVSGGGELNTANDTASDATAILRPPDLAVSLTHGSSFNQGQS